MLPIASNSKAHRTSDRVICNQPVAGSIPIASSNNFKGLQKCRPFLFISGLGMG